MADFKPLIKLTITAHMKTATTLLLILVTALSIHSQNITGKWHGLLNVQGMQLRVNFNISTTEEGYTSTMDSPDQGAYGLKVASTTFKNDTLKLSLPNLMIEYAGTFNNSTTFLGTFKQAGQSFAMDLSREAIEKEAILRPQEPKEPFAYYTEEVTFVNTKDQIALAGTLNLPSPKGTHPIVVLITGSGPQNRNEELFGHKPFLVLADHLTKNGIGVLRYDDRGVGASTGVFKTATSADFATDVEAAIAYLKTRPEVDKTKIGLIGHSEGGLIAPMVASASMDVAYMVLLAGPGITGADLLLLQNDLISQAAGISDTDIKKNHQFNKGAFDIIKKDQNTELTKSELIQFFKAQLNTDSSFAKKSGMNNAVFINTQVNQLMSPWMMYFLTYNPAPALEKVKCPVLALNGSKDLQVPAAINLEAIKKALDTGGNKSHLTREMPQLNHLFQECKTGVPAEYGQIEQTISPAALTQITNWILQQTQ